MHGGCDQELSAVSTSNTCWAGSYLMLLVLSPLLLQHFPSVRWIFLPGDRDEGVLMQMHREQGGWVAIIGLRGRATDHWALGQPTTRDRVQDQKQRSAAGIHNGFASDGARRRWGSGSWSTQLTPTVAALCCILLLLACFLILLHLHTTPPGHRAARRIVQPLPALCKLHAVSYPSAHSQAAREGSLPSLTHGVVHCRPTHPPKPVLQVSMELSPPVDFRCQFIATVTDLASPLPAIALAISRS
ncbi:hypothetical protein VTN00DRAFT_6695 [Thermoascus crustaceus]|uniref:uncharacterized protein n=1 Tax=Thermoascus crustaceus TaxID=5088 RepID=UPI0037430369